MFKLKNRDTFYLCGFLAETCLNTCEKDLSELWDQFNLNKDKLFDLFGHREDFYGLMWTLDDQRYCYLIGIEMNEPEKVPADFYCKCIPGTLFAVLQVPKEVSAVTAWTEYYEKVLPEAGYTPDKAHGLNFEYYPEDNNHAYELWTPVVKDSILIH